MHLNRQFKTLSEEVDTIYLNEQELDSIYRLDLRYDRRLERVRDLFLIGCYTGLRFGDLMLLRKENITKTERGYIIKLRTQKTDEMVVIPVHPIILEIIEKYDGNLPQPMSDVKMNKYIKDIGELAKIEETVKTSKTVGGVQTRFVNKKYELITVHTARRSFATNMYLNDVPTISIMKITGHRSEKAFLRYIRITPEQNANKLMDHPFFSTNKIIKE
jgi:integrase